MSVIGTRSLFLSKKSGIGGMLSLERSASPVLEDAGSTVIFRSGRTSRMTAKKSDSPSVSKKTRHAALNASRGDFGSTSPGFSEQGGVISSAPVATVSAERALSSSGVFFCVLPLRLFP